MNCGNSEESLALYIDEEMSALEMKRIGQHLESCAACRGVAAALRQSQLLVKTLSLVTVNSNVLAHVHQQVMDQIVERKRPPSWWIETERALFSGFRWRFALAGVASFVVVLGIALTIRPEFHKSLGSAVSIPNPVPQLDTLSTATDPAAETVQTVPPAAKTVHHLKHKEQKTDVAASEKKPRPIMVKLYTDDPGVVIYWSIDGNGETQ